MIRRSQIREFPSEGEIYRMEKADKSLPPSQQREEKVSLLTFKCNIQEASASDNSGFINASFRISFPYESDISFKRGDFFDGSVNGLIVKGEIIGIFPSQLGKCSIYIKDVNS